MSKGFRALVHLPRFELGTPSVSGRCANRTALQVRGTAFSCCLAVHLRGGDGI